MSVTKTGIDIVVNLVDKTGSQFSALTRKVDGLGRIGPSGGRLQMDDMGNVTEIGRGSASSKLKTLANTEIGGQLGSQLAKGAGGLMAVRAADALLEGIIDGIKNGTGTRGVAIAMMANLSDQIRSLPLLGAIGDLGARGLGKLFGDGAQTFEERQSVLDAERAANVARVEFNEKHKAQVAAFEAAEKQREQDDEYHRERMETIRMMNEQERLFDATREQESLEIWRAEQEAIRAKNESDRLFDAMKEEQEMEAHRAEQEAIRGREEAERIEDDRRKQDDIARQVRDASGRLSPTVESRRMIGLGAIFQNRRDPAVEQLARMNRSIDRMANDLTSVANGLRTVEVV